MTSPTLNALRVMRATITECRTGNWSADVDADGSDVQSGAAVLTLGDVAWNGTIIRGDVAYGRFKCRMVGGAGGLGRRLDAKSYRDVSLSLIVADLMTETGEIFDSASDSVEGYVVRHWQRASEAASTSLTNALSVAFLNWRMLRTGKLFWTAAAPVEQTIEGSPLVRDPITGYDTFGPPSPTAEPNYVINGKTIDAVVTYWESGRLRQELWYRATP